MPDVETDTDTTDVVDTPTHEPSKLAWRTLVGAAIGGGAIVIAAAFGLGAIRSEGASNVRSGGPGGQFPGGQFGPPGPGQGGMQFGPPGQMQPPPRPFRQQR